MFPPSGAYACHEASLAQSHAAFLEIAQPTVELAVVTAASCRAPFGGIGEAIQIGVCSSGFSAKRPLAGRVYISYLARP